MVQGPSKLWKDKWEKPRVEFVDEDPEDMKGKDYNNIKQAIKLWEYVIEEAISSLNEKPKRKSSSHEKR